MKLIKLIFIIFVYFVLVAQMPPDIIIDENEKDIRIKPNISGTEIVLYGVMPSGKKDIIIEVVGPARNIGLEEKRRIYDDGRRYLSRCGLEMESVAITFKVILWI